MSTCSLQSEWTAVSHAHFVDANWDFGFFYASTGEAPMAGGVSVGAIDYGDILRLGPLDDTSDRIIHDLLCPYPDLRRIVARSHI